MNWFNFIDNLLFGISIVKKEYTEGILYIKLCNSVEFNIYISEDGLILYDILYWHQDSIKESEEFGFYIQENGKMTNENQEIIKKIFQVPIYCGWTDVHHFCRGELLKIDRYYGIGDKMEDKVSNTFIISKFLIFSNILNKKTKKIIEIFPV